MSFNTFSVRVEKSGRDLLCESERDILQFSILLSRKRGKIAF
jgi:hypothetical protein